MTGAVERRGVPGRLSSQSTENERREEVKPLIGEFERALLRIPQFASVAKSWLDDKQGVGFQMDSGGTCTVARTGLSRTKRQQLLLEIRGADRRVLETIVLNNAAERSKHFAMYGITKGKQQEYLWDAEAVKKAKGVLRRLKQAGRPSEGRPYCADPPNLSVL